jgi:hypothetical protein
MQQGHMNVNTKVIEVYAMGTLQLSGPPESTFYKQCFVHRMREENQAPEPVVTEQ